MNKIIDWSDLKILEMWTEKYGNVQKYALTSVTKSHIPLKYISFLRPWEGLEMCLHVWSLKNKRF